MLLPFYEEDYSSLFCGDVFGVMPEIPKDSIDMIASSPPYYKQRTYPIEGDQFGQERTENEYLDKTLRLFSLFKPALKTTGTVWWNIGDSRGKQGLCLLPHRIAYGLQQEGWIILNIITWIKPNAMPESVNRRFTDVCETILLLSKSKKYWFDNVSIMQPFAKSTYDRVQYPIGTNNKTITQNETGIGGHSPQGENFAHLLDNAGANCWDAWIFNTAAAQKRNKQTLEHYACVDEETECLTDKGWLKWNELRKGMNIATYNLERQKLCYQALEEVYGYDVLSTNLISIKHRSLDVLMTPNHRNIVKLRSGREVVKEARELKTSDKLRVSAKWEDSEGIEPISDAMAELLGWYIAEGYECKSSPSIEIYQNEGDKAEIIRVLLSQVEAEWREASFTRQWRGRDSTSVAFRVNGFVAYRIRELCPQKQFPNDVLKWTQPLVRRMVIGLIKGDGYERLDGRVMFVQKDTKRADMFQALATKLGYSSTKSWKGRIWQIYLSNATHRVMRNTKSSLLKYISYSGKIWCPRTPNGTFVARRNGRVFITGNTFPEELPRRCILAGCPPYICSNCGKPYARKINKEMLSDNRKANAKLLSAFNDGLGKTSVFRVGGRPMVTTTGWSPACDCDAKSLAGTVLDPFCGSGTTLSVAKRMGRQSIGIEIVQKYAKASVNQIQKTCFPFMPVIQERDAIAPEPEKQTEQSNFLFQQKK